MYSFSREQISSAALAFLLLSSFDPAAANPARLQSHENPTWSEWRLPSDTGIRWPRSVRDFVYPEEIPGQSSTPTNRKGPQTHWQMTSTTEQAWVWGTEDITNTGSSNNAVTVEQVSLADFGYADSNGPHVWAKKFPRCGGIHQSPINLNLENAIQPPEGVDPNLFLKYYDAPATQMSLSNTGHSIRLTGNWSTGQRPTVSGAVLNGEYAVSEVHVHWGEDEDEGSEHFVNGENYPMEMHVVHYKSEYGSFDKARNYKDGLAVISYLFEVQDEKNQGLQRLIEAAKQVVEPSSPPVTVSPFSLDKLATPFNRNYASYPGSLTTPPCSEIVTWIVNLTPQRVSSDQLRKLRKMKTLDGRRLLKNFRPLQHLNGRVIKFVP